MLDHHAGAGAGLNKQTLRFASSPTLGPAHMSFCILVHVFHLLQTSLKPPQDNVLAVTHVVCAAVQLMPFLKTFLKTFAAFGPSVAASQSDG
jgi:hypothetical protein